RLLINRLVSSIRGVIVGKFLLAFIQGLVAMVGFLFVGVPNALFLGFLTMISSFVPMIGTGIVVLPVIIYLLIFKSFVPALILLIWYALVHFSIDNIVAPKIIGSTTQIHPLLILLSILGGIELFGALGFFFGPIIVAIFLTLVESYKTNYISS
ncbi:MAG: AI-2E family transporter, partial [Candidatus Staskawiczbacteria bacterium]|nr:AI-2E family transporter [Candidatus Staskawiczbacteria bacterium]